MKKRPDLPPTTPEHFAARIEDAAKVADLRELRRRAKTDPKAAAELRKRERESHA